MTTSCNMCHKHIQENEQHYTVNLHKERMQENEINVDYAETILTTCIDCGHKIHKDALTIALSAPDALRAEQLAKLLIPLELN